MKIWRGLKITNIFFDESPNRLDDAWDRWVKD